MTLVSQSIPQLPFTTSVHKNCTRLIKFTVVAKHWNPRICPHNAYSRATSLSWCLYGSISNILYAYTGRTIYLLLRRPGGRRIFNERPRRRDLMKNEKTLKCYCHGIGSAARTFAESNERITRRKSKESGRNHLVWVCFTDDLPPKKISRRGRLENLRYSLFLWYGQARPSFLSGNLTQPNTTRLSSKVLT